MREREPNVFKCSFRSADAVNVSAICQTIGGGGHAKAAGCTVEGERVTFKVRLPLKSSDKRLQKHRLKGK